jgi:hypothetical protein
MQTDGNCLGGQGTVLFGSARLHIAFAGLGAPAALPFRCAAVVFDAHEFTLGGLRILVSS